MIRLSRKVVVIASVSALAVLAAQGAYYFAVRRAWIRYNEYDRREEGSIRVGDHAPDLALAGYDGSTVRLGALWAEKPLVLVFGSCT